jgi:crotonobetainyl-CoA:carnitine CoA-transferase CaiB-like acyl-CoA transferase
MKDGPLSGLKVVDLSRVLAGPFCSMNLGDMGADVIKVERPDGGDDTRSFGPPFYQGVSTYYLAINRNKRSIALDLKHPDGKAVLWSLLKDADILLENFRPGTLDRLGFDYATCRAKNPRLIYCSISEFGHFGTPEWSQKPGYDLIIQGMGGIQSITGSPEGAPSKVGASIADVVAGMNAFTGILLALFARERSKEGQKVDTSMLDGQVSLLTYLATAWLNTGVVPPRLGNRHLSIAPYSTFEASDGWLNVAVANEKLWSTFCEAINRPDMRDDPRFHTNIERVKNVDSLEAELTRILGADRVQNWIERFTAAGIPAGPVLTIDQVLAHAQLVARGMLPTMQHPTAGEIRLTGIPHHLTETPGSIRRPPPELGEHTTEILLEIGFTKADIHRLQTAGVIA